MGLFDEVNKTTGVKEAGLLTQAKWFATLDINSIIRESGKALVTLLVNAFAFFGNLFDKWNWNDDEKVLGERMIDQFQGMAQALSQVGYLDKSIGEYADANPQTVELVSRNYGNYKYIIPIARQLFTVFFGVPILSQKDLNALQDSAERYYQVSGRTDVPRAAVDRAVTLKKNFFPDSTYNKTFWDLNKFQQYPLKAPIPGLTFGTLYTADIIGGGRVEEGLLVAGGPLIGDETDGDTVLDSSDGSGGLSVDTIKDNLPLLLAGVGLLLLFADGDN